MYYEKGIDGMSAPLVGRLPGSKMRLGGLTWPLGRQDRKLGFSFVFYTCAIARYVDIDVSRCTIRKRKILLKRLTGSPFSSTRY